MDIQTKDGILLRNIPDGTPDDVIKARINEIRSGQQPKPVAPQEPQIPMAQRLQQTDTSLNMGERIAQHLPASWGDNGGGVVGGIVQGMADPSVALGQMAANAVGLGDKVNPAITQQNQQYDQARQQQGRTGTDWPRIAGNVGMSAPLMMLPGGQSIPAQIGMSTAVGAGAGALQPVVGARDKQLSDLVTGEEPPSFWGEKGKQAGMGAGLGALFGLGGAGLQKAISPTVRPEVQALMDDGVRLTPGQIAGGITQKVEDKAQSIPLVGDMIARARSRGVEDLNRAAYARALKGTNVNAKTLPVGQEGILAVKEAVGKQYDNLLPKLNFIPDQQFSQELSNVNKMAANLGEKEANKFKSVLADALSKSTPNGRMTGETYKIVESKLGQEAKKFSSSTDAYQRELGDALKETQNIFKTTLDRSNPQYAKELAQANENYANYVRLRAAGAKAGDQSGGFSPAQLAAAIRGSDRSVGKGNVATGQALMQDLGDRGVNVMGSKVPDSGTATRLMLGGAAGGAAYMEPTLALGAGAASLPYTKVGQKIAEALLTKRPVGAKATAEALRKTLPYFPAAMVPANQ
jgi:hypothetical protein